MFSTNNWKVLKHSTNYSTTNEFLVSTTLISVVHLTVYDV